MAVISDTHLPRGSRALPAACVERLRAADLILHAGDLVTAGVLADLRAIGPPGRGGARQRRRRRGPPRCCRRRGSWPPGRRASRWSTTPGRPPGAWPACARRFPDADAVVFGHSHIPLHERDPATGFQIFNPGSPTDRRRQPTHTMGLARIGEDGAVSFELIDLG